MASGTPMAHRIPPQTPTAASSTQSRVFQTPNTPTMALETLMAPRLPSQTPTAASSTESRVFQTPNTPTMALGRSSTPTMASGTPITPRIPPQTPTGAASMSTSASSSNSFTVRMQRNTNKKFDMMKFKGHAVHFSKAGPVYMQRENNNKNFKTSHDVDKYPKSGAESEFGRQEREEARHKRYGIQYNPHAQPWLMHVAGKNGKKYKGTKDGGITENTSYFFFKINPTIRTFEAYPVDESYSFKQCTNYRSLNSEEAEEEFSRRDKNWNLGAIMIKKRLKGEDALEEEEKEELRQNVKRPRKDTSDSKQTDMDANSDAEDDLEEEEREKLWRMVKKPRKYVSYLKITDKDDWDASSDDSEGSDAESESKTKKKKAKQAHKKKHNRGKQKSNSDDEALEERDDQDEGAEVDYMSSSDSEDDQDTFEEKGVADEKGLRTLIDSDAEDEEDEEKKQEQPDDEEKKQK